MMYMEKQYKIIPYTKIPYDIYKIVSLDNKDKEIISVLNKYFKIKYESTKEWIPTLDSGVDEWMAYINGEYRPLIQAGIQAIYFEAEARSIKLTKEFPMVKISKIQDEYYLVKIGIMYYLCDQLEGLKEFLNLEIVEKIKNDQDKMKGIKKWIKRFLKHK